MADRYGMASLRRKTTQATEPKPVEPEIAIGDFEYLISDLRDLLTANECSELEDLEERLQAARFDTELFHTVHRDAQTFVQKVLHGPRAR
jgi:hypothetical protein